jgi:hypothetical protein
MLTFTESAVVSGDPAFLWEVLSDLPALPEWDPHVEGLGLEAAFEVGASGWTKPKGAPKGKFTVTAIEPGRGYSTESPMPMGRMSVTNRLEPGIEGLVTVSRSIEVHGGFAPMFKWFFMKPMRRDMHDTFKALEQEAGRRASAASAEAQA